MSSTAALNPTDISHSENFANEQARIQGPIIVTWALAIIACILRFIARRLSKAGLWYDDWLVIPALFSASALSYFSAGWMIDHGLGKPIYILALNAVTSFLEGLYITEICWTLAIFAVKCSIIAFYWRVFSEVKYTRTTISVLLGATVCWGIAVLFATIFSCVPISKFWKLNIGGTCQNTYAIYLGGSIPHIATDAILLFLPMPYIWKSQMRTAQKIVLCAIFCLGGFVTIVSVIRVVYIVTTVGNLGQPDLTTNIANTVIWSSVEVNTAVICACLPSLRPIWSLLAEAWVKLRNRKSQHMQGKDLLFDMIPRRQRNENAPILPVVRAESVHTTMSRNRADLAPIETEANEQPLPETDAVGGERRAMHFETETNERAVPETDAVGPEIREMHDRPVAGGELGDAGSRRPIAELEGVAYVLEMQAREVPAAELNTGEHSSS